MSKLPPPMLNDGEVAHGDAQIAGTCASCRRICCITSRWRVVALRRRASGSPWSVSRHSRPSENARSSCGAMRT